MIASKRQNQLVPIIAPLTMTIRLLIGKTSEHQSLAGEEVPLDTTSSIPWIRNVESRDRGFVITSIYRFIHVNSILLVI